MINGLSTYPIRGTTASEVVVLDGRFAPNGSGAISAASYGGTLQGLFTAASAGAASGKYVVTLDRKLRFPKKPVITVSATCADLTDTNRFVPVLVGDWDNTNHRFTIGCVQKDLAFDVPADANNWISFTLTVSTTTAPR